MVRAPVLEGREVRLKVGDLVAPRFARPAYHCSSVDDPDIGTLSFWMGRRDIALVVGFIDVPATGWRELQVLLGGKLGWVIEPHMQRVSKGPRRV